MRGSLGQGRGCRVGAERASGTLLALTPQHTHRKYACTPASKRADRHTLRVGTRTSVGTHCRATAAHSAHLHHVPDILHAHMDPDVRGGRDPSLLGQLSHPSPWLLPSDLTWVQSGSSWWQQAEVHLPQMDCIVDSREEHTPGGHHSTHQHVDGEEKKGDRREDSPRTAGERLRQRSPGTPSWASFRPPCLQKLCIS
jgi:hypothetical protein